MRRTLPIRHAAALCSVVLLTTGCGVSEPIADPADLDPTGIWQLDVAGVSETTLELASDGSFERVEADRVAETCEVTMGAWSVDGSTLLLGIERRDGAPASGSESFSFDLGSQALALNPGGEAAVYAVARRMPSCPDYGWGAWVGRLEAEVDGVATSFSNWSVDLDVDGGTLAVRAYPCSGCGPDDPELILEIDGTPEALEPGTYTVQNVPDAFRSFFALYHPEPGDPDFQGFTTERLLPPGQLVLTNVSDERVLATFSFQGNPRADGETASDGSTTVLVSEGVVDLTYR